ncbi:MAG: S9 family peptidase [Bacillota bacterium]|nr:S9 family peptidase [Bacillota bacterium]
MPVSRRILTTALHNMGLPADARLSPDGRQVAYVVTRADLQANSYSSAIWLAAADGAMCPRRITGAGAARGSGRDHSPRWAPDSRRLAFISDRSAHPGIWILDLASGGEAQPVGAGCLEVTDMAWSPDGAYIACVAREPKPEPAKPSDWSESGWRPGENPDVTVVTRLRYKFNGRGILDERYQKIHLVEMTTGRTRQITSGSYDDVSPCWSPDCRWLLFSSSRHPERELRPRTDIWGVEVSSVTSSPDSPTAAPTAVRLSATHTGSLGSPTVSPDGHWLLCLGTAEETGGAANTHLWLIPLRHAINAGRTAAAGTTGEDPWTRPAMSAWLDILAGLDRSLGNSIGADVRTDAGLDRALWSGDGAWVYFTATDGGYCRLYRARLPEGVPLEGYVPVIEQLTTDEQPVVGSVSSAHPEAGKELLALFAAGPTSPGDIYLAEPAQGAAPPRAPAQTEPLTPLGCPLRLRPLNFRRLTRHSAWAEEADLSRPERVIFPSVEDGRIEGWLMQPAGFDESARYPAVLEIHGGPHVTYGLAFMHEFQVLCARGFAVFFTNPRGSKGYGEAFAARVVGDWAGIDYQDLMAAADWLEKVPWVDPQRVGVTGGSQGGYLTNFLIGHTTRFAAAVTQRSMSNLYSKYGVSDIGWTGDRWGMGGKDLWDSEDFIMERSPIRYAPHVRTPVLIIHSEQDLRCPMEQGEQWYVALRRLGVQTEFVRFAGENHELSRSGKPRNRVERLERIAGWFERFLPPSAAT